MPKSLVVEGSDGTSELAVARRNYANMGLALTAEDEATYKEIDRLLGVYRKARDAYSAKDTPKNREAFKAAKYALQEARRAQYAVEVDHPQHTRSPHGAVASAAANSQED